MNMEISQLQHIKYRLMSRKQQLVDEISRSDKKTVIEDMERDTKNIYDKVLPLVSEIHNLELRSLELKEQIQLATMEQEANTLLSTLTGTSTKKKGSLSRWFMELEQMNTAGSTVNNPRYQMWMLKSRAQKEKLEFTVFHCGVCVTVQIFQTTQSQEQEDSSVSDLSSDSFDVWSDIFIPNLLQTVKCSIVEKYSISGVVEHITQYITDEIVPHIHVAYEVPEKGSKECKSSPS
ncbi:uncharacterized protein LOC121371388 isoform X2 [Gigantopelta aegis]|nr:uncharacterized protein LOC121371388 isoform X2 [Gigantopelta aegis]